MKTFYEVQTGTESILEKLKLINTIDILVKP